MHVTGHKSVRFEPSSSEVSPLAAARARLNSHPPGSLGGIAITEPADLENEIRFEVEGARISIAAGADRSAPNVQIVDIDVELWGPDASDSALARGIFEQQIRAVINDVVTLVISPEPDFELDADAEAAAADRATQLMSRASTGAAAVSDLALVVRCIDLTTLEGDDSVGRVRALCAQAIQPDPTNPDVGPTAAVCVYPSLVGLAAQLTSETDVRVASVAGAFPTGLSSLEVRVADIEAAVAAGADEIDIVLNRSLFLDGALDEVKDELEASRVAAGDSSLKVILEVGELRSSTLIRRAAELAIAANADFIKTSTGKTKINATPGSVLVMAEVIAAHHRNTGERVGLKIAGGVRTAEDALAYVSLVRSILGEEWLTPELFRFGASSLLGSVVEGISA